MKLRFFDFEVTPNWWLCVLGDLPDGTDKNNITENIKDTFIEVNSDMPDARDKLLQLMRETDTCVIGYNIKGYDLMIANGIYQGFNPQQIKMINDIIINPSMQRTSKEHMRMAPFAKKRMSGICYQDLMDDGTGSLKEKEAVLGLNILESSVSFDKEDLTEYDKESLTYYCKQDVYAAMIYYIKVVHPYTKTKLALGKRFNIPEKTVRASTNAKLVALALGAKRDTFGDENITQITLPNSIRDYVYENVPSKILEHLLNNTEQLTVNLFGNTVDYGNGGIHSVLCNDLYVESDDEWTLLNVDATSYYPSMLIQFNCLSRTIPDNKLFKYIFEERVRIKHKPNKTEEDEENQLAYKLVLNTTFGASGNKYLDTYDPHMCTRTCRLGQIFLTALACKLNKTVNSIKIIQSNTDGILVYCKRTDLPIVKKCMQEWTDISGINMEESYVEKIWQRDVNNYLMVVKEQGKTKIKRKGGWLVDTWEKPGYVMVGTLSAFVSAKAVTNYLLNNDDIVESIVNNKNITDFIITCKKGPSYSKVIQKLSNGDEITLFKCNRVLASKDKSLGKIYKLKKYKDRISYTQMAGIPENCKLMNDDLSKYDFDNISKEIDYMFYIQKAADLLNLDWKELKHGHLNKTEKFNYFEP